MTKHTKTSVCNENELRETQLICQDVLGSLDYETGTSSCAQIYHFTSRTQHPVLYGDRSQHR